MSSINRGGERRQHDAYMTPPWCVERLLEAWRPSGTLSGRVEPALGTGNILQVFRRKTACFGHWTTYDIRDVPAFAGEHHQNTDFLGVTKIDQNVGLCITNPPYSLAEDFVRHAYGLYPNAELVFLLRLAFLSTERRLKLWRHIGVPDIYVLPNRPSFTGGGTDSTDYAWFVWPVDHDPEHPRKTGKLQVLSSTPASARRSLYRGED